MGYLVGSALAGCSLLGVAGFSTGLPKLHNQELPKPPPQQQQLPMGFTDASTAEEEQLLTYVPHNPEGKPHLVILGTGWGSIGVLQHLDPGNYVITVVSPVNYFLFTPLLPSATVGTIDPSSLIEPIRSILRKYGHDTPVETASGETVTEASFLEVSAQDLEFPRRADDKNKRLKCRDSQGRDFWIPFDKLVIAVGSKSITFGVPGVDENCFFLKTCQHAKDIRAKIISNFEKASYPTVSEEERRRLLTFVICGGGPTGVEFAAELYDFLEEDLLRYYPSMKQYLDVSIIQSQEHVLNTYDEKISKMTEEKFQRDGINVIRNSRVTSVSKQVLDYTDNHGKIVKKPFGMCVWTTGVGMQPFTEKVAAKLDSQQHSRSLTVDDRLRVKGIYQGENDHADASIWAIGDCSTIAVPNLVDKMLDIFKSADIDNSGGLTYEEFKALSSHLKKQHPITRTYLVKLKSMFQKFDVSGDGKLDFKEFEAMLRYLDKQLRPLPATAQVASQQGKYVASMLNWLRERELLDDLRFEDSSDPDPTAILIESMDRAFFPAFFYKHLGSMAYIGSETAIFDSGTGFVSGGRFATFWLWKSVYLSELVSVRQRLNLAADWARTFCFGRDISDSQ